MTPVQHSPSWVPVAPETLADMPIFAASIEYALATRPPLTLRERISGLRHWPAPNGVVLTVHVGWRGRLHDIARTLDDIRHPLRYRTRRLTWFERITGWAERDDA